MIKKEQKLLDFISQEKLSQDARRKINKHVEEIKGQLENEKQKYYHNISKQKRHFEGQKILFEKLEKSSIIDVKHTPLKQKMGEIYQKGVDVLLAVDMVSLAHKNAYDIAIVLSGDTDLIEAIKVVEGLGKTVIIFSYHSQEESNISDLMNVGKFVNLKDLTNKEIEQMSELRVSKK